MSKCPKNTHYGYQPKSDFLDWFERDEIRQNVFQRDPHFCVWCSAVVTDRHSDNYFSVDHVITRQDGGAYHVDNLVLACRSCNTDRGNLSVLQYLTKRRARQDSHETGTPTGS